MGPSGPRVGVRLRQGGWHVGKPTTKSDRAGSGGYDGWDRGAAGPGCQRAREEDGQVRGGLGQRVSVTAPSGAPGLEDFIFFRFPVRSHFS
jgi:hypothetical protein